MPSPPALKHVLYQGVSFCMPVSKKSATCELRHILYCKTHTQKKNYIGPFRTRCGMLTSGVVLHDRFCIQLLALKHCWSISTGSCLTTLLTALISIQTTTTCLPTWRTGCNHSTSAIMRSWWKVLKHGRAHKLLWHRHKNLFPDMTSISVLAVTMLRSSLGCMYFLYIIILFLLLVLLTAHRRLLSALV
jgi:hypothetical protein